MEELKPQSCIIKFNNGDIFVYSGWSNIQPNDLRRIVNVKFTPLDSNVEYEILEEKQIEYKEKKE